MKLDPSAIYTRKQIADLFGGIGAGILPAKDGEIVCGLFDPFTSAVTHLSGEIDVYQKTLPKLAERLDKSIPAFLKVSTQFWRYAGEYKLAKIERTKQALDEAKKELGREDIAAILRFEPAKPKLRLVTNE